MFETVIYVALGAAAVICTMVRINYMTIYAAGALIGATFGYMSGLHAPCGENPLGMFIAITALIYGEAFLLCSCRRDKFAPRVLAMIGGVTIAIPVMSMFIRGGYCL